MPGPRSPSTTTVWRRGPKSPDVYTHGRSTAKLLTCTVARQVLTDLNAPLTVTSADVTGRPGVFTEGDVVTVSDLIHAALMPSDARATRTLSRASGEVLLGEDPGDSHARFLAEVNAWAAANCGWFNRVLLLASDRIAFEAILLIGSLVPSALDLDDGHDRGPYGWAAVIFEGTGGKNSDVYDRRAAI